MGDLCHRRADWLKFPSPQVTRRLPTRLGGPPGDPPALVELDHVVLPDFTPGQCRPEHIASTADPLPGFRRGQVVVAIPARLFGRIGDQVEDRRRADRDLTGGADHPRRLMISCHAAIQAPGPPRHLARLEAAASRPSGQTVMASLPRAWPAWRSRMA